MSLYIATRSIGDVFWMRAFLLDLWCGDENGHGGSQVVGDGEVGAGQIADGDASGADKVQCVYFFNGKIHMLGEVEDV